MSERVPDDWQEYIRLGIDYGTGYLKLAVQYIYPGRKESSQDIDDVCLEDLNDIAQEVAIKQVAVWTKDHGLIWGKRPVQRWIQDHPEDRDKVLSAWKLALMANFQDREIVRQTTKALGSLDQRSHEGGLEELITEHLRQIKARTLEWCQEKSPANYFLRPDWSILPWEVQIAVPAMWDDASKGIMSTAAWYAGFQHCNLREEPQCVAGAFMSQLQCHRQAANNDQVLFMDVGAGTSDIAVVRFRDALSNSTRMTLERVGASRGNAYGSFAVNNSSWMSFMAHNTVLEHGGLRGFCDRMNITREDCQQQVSDYTEMIKSQFDPESNKAYHIVIHGVPTLDRANAAPLDVEFKREDVLKWHDDWIEKNEQLLGEALAAAPNCRKAIFTGKGSTSMYFRSRLKKKLSDHKVAILDLKFEYPCSQGALLHYMFEEDIPSMENATFYTLRTETFNRHVHKDFAAPPPKKRRTEDYSQQRKRKQPPAKQPSARQPPAEHQVRKQKPSKYKFDEKDRLVPIMKVGAHDEIEVFQVPMEFNINAKYDARLHFDVYRTTRPDLHSEHGPLRDEDGEVFEDLIRYPVAFVDLPDMSQFFVAKKAGRESFYKVSGVLEMRKTEDTLEVVVTLLCSGFDWKWSEDGSVAPDQTFVFPEDQIIHKESRVIWNAKCSSFVKGNVAESEPEPDDNDNQTRRTSRRLMDIMSRDQLKHIPRRFR